MNELVSWASCDACCAPVRAWACGGSTGFTSRSSFAGVTPALAASEISSNRSPLLKSCCAVGSAKPASVAPPRALDPPNLTMPDTWNCCTGPCVWTPTVSPTWMCFFDAVLLSITTCFPWGQAPSTSVSGLKGESALEIEKPRFGAPPNVIALPFFTSCASPLTDPAARATSGRPRSCWSSAAETVGANDPCPCVRWIADLPETTTSVPWRTSVKMKLNALSIESVSTSVPLTMATPSTTASAVNAVRNLRPMIPARATRIMRWRGSSPRGCRLRSSAAAPRRSRRRPGTARDRRSPPRARRG